MNIAHLDRDDFINNDDLYDWWFSLPPSDRARRSIELEDQAKACGIRAVQLRKILKAREEAEAQDGTVQGLKAGPYREKDGSICRKGVPFLPGNLRPVRIIKDDEHKAELSDGSVWPMTTISKSSEITALAGLGHLINSGNAAEVVRFFSKVIELNPLPEMVGASSFGWHGDNFLPFAEDVVFSGDEGSRGLFDAIHQKGDFDSWKAAIVPMARQSPAFRAAMLGSLAAPILKLVGIDSFFVHLWGFSGGGKTLSAMAAMSAWGDPSSLKVILKGTAAGIEMRAATMGNMPLFLDEAQTMEADKYSSLVYDLCSNEGKLRATKHLGTRKSKSWNTCFLSTGENPLVGEDCATGVKNRVVEG